MLLELLEFLYGRRTIEENPERKTTSPSPRAFLSSQSVLVLCPECVCVCVAGERTGASERWGGEMPSSACLSGHTIQRREKPFIQHSLPTPPSELPSNSVWAEWTRWHGSSALTSHRNTHRHTHFVLYSFLHSHSDRPPLFTEYPSSSSSGLTTSSVFLSACPLFTTVSPP